MGTEPFPVHIKWRTDVQDVGILRLFQVGNAFLRSETKLMTTWPVVAHLTKDFRTLSLIFKVNGLFNALLLVFLMGNHYR